MAQDGTPPVDTTTLLEAYLAAVYRAQVEGASLPLRVGEPAPALDAAMPAAPGAVATWTLVTAWNPQSCAQDAGVNATADAALQAWLRARGLQAWPAVGGSADGQWEEHGWLVAGLEAATADALARRHDQAGILHWSRGAPVRLRMYRERPPGNRTGWVDWVHRPR